MRDLLAFFATACSFRRLARAGVVFNKRREAAILTPVLACKPIVIAGFYTLREWRPESPSPPPPAHRHTCEQSNRWKSEVRSSGPNVSGDEKKTTPQVMSMQCPLLVVDDWEVATLALRKLFVVL